MMRDEQTTASAWRGYPIGYPPGFTVFHDAHPEVFEAIIDHARTLKRQGHSGVGMRFLFEFERYYGKRKDAENYMQYGLNNSWSTSYGRLAEEMHPDLRGFFRLRSTTDEKAAVDPNQLGMEFD